jgi:hypothetical protein
MKEVRCSFEVIVLLAVLVLSGIGLALTANTTTNLHAYTSFRAELLTSQDNAHFSLFKICPEGGPDDC